MAWILLIVALALATGVLIITFGYGKSVLALVAVLVVGLGIVIWYAEFYEGTRSNLIPVDDVSLDNFDVRVTYGNSYEMFARLSNRSTQHMLTAVGIELSASDCTTKNEGQSCVIVGQQEKEIQISVPAAQARDITQQFIFPPIRPQGELSWGYTILYTKAEK